MPELMDTVKSKINDTSGTIDAIYTKDGEEYFDVRVDERMYYETHADRWEVVLAADE